jgi:hypothetical protein
MSETQEKNIPSKEEVMQFLQEQLDVKKLQAELAELNMKIAVGRAEELKALMFIEQVTNGKPRGDEYQGPENAQTHVVTQEDLDNNPDLVEAGVEVGEEIIIEKPAKEKKLKKK